MSDNVPASGWLAVNLIFNDFATNKQFKRPFSDGSQPYHWIQSGSETTTQEVIGLFVGKSAFDFLFLFLFFFS